MYSLKTIAFWSSLGIASNLAAQNPQPNIILLTADDLGWNDISSDIATMGNGSKNHQTPNIDKLISEGMAFTNAYTQQNSAPTRAALLTGQYATRTNLYNVNSLDRFAKGNQDGIKKAEAKIIPPTQTEPIKPGTLTFAKLLKDAGYETYIFGKVHGFKVDEKNDFTQNFSCNKTIKNSDEESSNYFAFQSTDGKWIFDNPTYNKFAQPYTEDYIRKNLLPFANGNNPLTLIYARKHFTDALGDVVIDEIAKAKTDKPFCMWVAFHAIHSDIVGREDLYEKYKKRTNLDSRHTNYKYAAITEQLDQTVGRIMAAIDDPNGDGDTSDSKRNNTVVIFMSDNGGVDMMKHSNAPLRASKGTLYEGGTRIPFAVRFPAKVKQSSVSDEPIHVVDYLPTFLDIAGIKYSNKTHILDGESFYPIITGKKKQLKRKSIYWHFPGYMDARGIPTSIINKRIGNKRYKYRFCYEYNTHELYNLTDDISETKNLLAGDITKQNLKIGNELLHDLSNWINQTKPLPMYYVKSGKQVALPKNIN